MEEVQFIESLGALNIGDGDALVVKLNMPITMAFHYHLGEYIKKNLPEKIKDTPVILLDPGMDLGVVRQGGG